MEKKRYATSDDYGDPAAKGVRPQPTASNASAKPLKPAFKLKLDELFGAAAARGDTSIDVRAADLHGLVGGYPGRGHSMPTCCSAMRDEIKPGDTVLCEPAGGTGAAYHIRFCLPR